MNVFVIKSLQPREDPAAKQAQDGTPQASETAPEYEVPFNLNNLRKHLAQMALARRVLPEDVAARQKLLEETVYDVAVERWKHQSELFEELGLGNTGLKQPDLQRWMWDWHQKLRRRLEAEIKDVVAHEKDLCE
jgi:DNA-directed RNA polymerase, mitochondrial